MQRESCWRVESPSRVGFTKAMGKKRFRGVRAGDEVWNTLQAIRKARPRQFLTVEEVLRELETFYLDRHVNLADNVRRVLEGKEPLEEILVYRVRRKGPPPPESEESPPPSPHPPDEG